MLITSENFNHKSDIKKATLEVRKQVAKLRGCNVRKVKLPNHSLMLQVYVGRAKPHYKLVSYDEDQLWYLLTKRREEMAYRISSTSVYRLAFYATDMEVYNYKEPYL